MKNASLKKNSAIVLGLCPTGLGVIRSLGKKGIPLKGFDYKPGGPGFYSKYAETEICPNPYLSPDELCTFLVNIGNNLVEKSVLYPTSDEFVLFISRYREQLGPFYLFSLPSSDLIESLLNKRWQYDMAKEFGVPYPQTFYPENKDDITKIKSTVSYPAIIKPCYTHLWKESGFSVKAFRVENNQELENALIPILEKQVEVIVQELIPGPVTSFYEVCSYLNQENKPLSVFIKRKLRQYPIEMGLGSLMESVKDTNLFDMSVKLMQGIKYHGINEVEYKKDPRDDLFKMIEINARVTLQNSLADYCGINFPYIQYRDLLKKKNIIENNYPEGVKWIWAEIDFEAFKDLYRIKEVSALNWIRSILASQMDAVFSLKDLSPFLRTIIFQGLIKNKIPSFFKRKPQQ